MAEYSGRDKRLQYLFEHIGDGGTANLYGTTAPDSSITADDGTLYIQYDDTSYEVVALFAMIEQSWQEINVGGGGSSGGSARYKEEVLWEDANGVEFYPSSQQTVELSDSIRNYQILCFVTSTKNAPAYRNQSMIPVSTLIGLNTNHGNTVNIGGHAYNVPSLDYVDDTHIKFFGYASAAENHLYAYRIIGIKFETMQTALIYSEEEREVGVWTDGKPLYQKTYEFSTVIPVSANTFTTIVSSAGLNIDTLVYGETSPSKEATFTPISVNVTANGDIQCYYITAWSIKYLTIRYTKTTDTAGSGTWTTTGEYAHHYSTSEKVIGTWIDGKPLYEKTLTKTFSTSDREGSTSFYHGSIDISSDIPNLEHGFVVTDASYYGTYPNERGFIFGYVEPDGSASGATVLVGTLFQRSNFTAQLTVRYTKTTD